MNSVTLARRVSAVGALAAPPLLLLDGRLLQLVLLIALLAVAGEQPATR